MTVSVLYIQLKTYYTPEQLWWTEESKKKRDCGIIIIMDKTREAQ